MALGSTPQLGRRWRRFRYALSELQLKRWLEGHYALDGKFYVWGQGSIGHPPDKPCQCATPDGLIGERHHPLVQRTEYRNRADYWRTCVADWYETTYGYIGRIDYDEENKRPIFPEENRLDRFMKWLIGRGFERRPTVWAPHRSQDSIYASDRKEGSC